MDSPINGESLVEEVRNELVELDSMAINDHAQRFEELHNKLSTALSSIDGL
jgi:ABC-type Zn uptake system ZnuABC Zn-binding protein ZnuA